MIELTFQVCVSDNILYINRFERFVLSTACRLQLASCFCYWASLRLGRDERKELYRPGYNMILYAYFAREHSLYFVTTQADDN
jgi:hypothetical protein